MLPASDLPAATADHVVLAAQEDVVRLRQRVRDVAVRLGLSLVEQTKLVTAASELARNAVLHGGGGSAQIAVLQAGARTGIRLVFADDGPGIADLERALTDGYSTGGGLGLGLGGARRLCDEFDVDSAPGRGTRVTIVKWKR